MLSPPTLLARLRLRSVFPAVVFILNFAIAVPAIAEETVVNCTMMTRRDVSTVEDALAPASKPASHELEFVIKFDDTQRKVTYVAGPAVHVVPFEENSFFVNKEYFQNSIVFNADVARRFHMVTEEGPFLHVILVTSIG